MKVVTGIAGFIGMHVAAYLLEQGETVIGVDNLNSYYDPSLKHARIAHLRARYPSLQTLTLDLATPEALLQALRPHADRITHIVHLAAQAGVRYSLEAPRSYLSSNINGTLEVLEACRQIVPQAHLVYASSSSVYGLSTHQPFTPDQRTDHPISLYAATKKSTEILVESYAHLYAIAATGLRFFTVYGPWGRPDMAYFSFTRKILSGEPILVYNYGDMRRDFTYIRDIVAGIIGVLGMQPSGHRIYNLGNHRSESLLTLIETLEEYLGKKAVRQLVPMQPGDVKETYADIRDSTRDFGYVPATSLHEGLKHFVDWYRHHYPAG